MIDEISALNYLEKEIKEYKYKKCGIHNSIFDKCNIQVLKNSIEKQQQYKAVEDELGIGLITLYKALTKGFYVKDTSQKGVITITFIPKQNTRLVAHGAGWLIIDNQHEYERAIGLNDLELMSRWQGWQVKAKDYGKTWALTREELENKLK